MRLVINMLILAMLLGVAGLFFWRHDAAGAESSLRQETRESVRRIQREVTLQGTLSEGTGSELNYPATVEAGWFDEGLPRNLMVDAGRPWLEIADQSQWHLAHPPDRIVVDGRAAMFWYNPKRGIVRARVSARGSDGEVLEAYNAANGVMLTDLYAAAVVDQ